MKTSRFAMLISPLFIAGLIFYFANWLMFALVFFGFGLGFIFLKVENWWRRVKDTI